MSAEHRRPNGDLSQGYSCGNCGKSCSMYGHMNMGTGENSCDKNPELVRLVQLANPPHGKKPHYKYGVE